MPRFPSHLIWPRSLMRDRQWMWELTAKNVSGGKSFAGAMPIARLDGGGLWAATMGDVQVSTPDQIRAFHAMATMLDGGANPVVLTARDERTFPAPLVNGVRLTSLPIIDHSDGSYFDDGTGLESSTVNATISTAADLRATTVYITVSVGSALRGGELFSIQHGTLSHRLYRIGTVTVSGGVTTATIRPPLREAVDAGTAIEFDQPKCTMRLASPDAMDLTRSRRLHGQANVRLIESFPPWP